MKAILFDQYGPPSVLQLAELPEPKAGANDILVEVRATSVNPVDCKYRSGKLSRILNRRFPKQIGADFSGVVLDSGDPSFRKGDEVYGMLPHLKGKACSERVIVNHQQLFFKPRHLSFEEAAVLPTTGLTALEALLYFGDIEPGCKVLINGCTGGVGSIATQIATYLGAKVTGVCYSGSIQVAQSLGAGKVIAYDQTNIHTEKEKYHIILDTVGNLRLRKMKNRLENKGHLSTTIIRPGAFLVALLNPVKVKVIMVSSKQSKLHQLKKILEDGAIHPLIEDTFPLEQTGDAHHRLESSRVMGKLAIRVQV
jgi:NADPH:quinone reductase-like Zn-dependent oxidoreductase